MSNTGSTQIQRRCTTGNRGSATVEAALGLPVVIVLTLGFIEIGWHVNCMQITHDAARQGARAAVSHENSNTKVETAVIDSLSSSFNVDPNAVIVRIAKLNDNGQEEYQVMDLSDNENGSAIRVTVTVDYAEFSPPSNFLGLQQQQLASSAVMQRSE